MTTPEPEHLERLLEAESGSTGFHVVRAENAVAAEFWGPVQYRIIVTFLVFAACWVAVLVFGLAGNLPLWQGLVLNSVIASTFYMPMHEATHRNIMGKNVRARWIDDVIGTLCSIPTGINFSAHRASHMRHHAHTNDPLRDPDHFTDGKLSELPAKFYGMTMLYAFLPMFALLAPSRILLPSALREVLQRNVSDRREGKSQFRFWFLTTSVLVVALLTGHFAAALMLWWIPARVQLCWLMFIFAWYPHHPANETSRYRHTRIAVFPGSGLLIRGHDHHAMHHLFPRVPHYRLRALWAAMADDMVGRGVRAEGRARGATGPIVW